MTQPASAHPIYFGWFILLALAVTEMLAWGATSYAGGLFIVPLEQEFGLSRAAASLPVSILFVGATISAPFVGRVLDRYSIQWVLGIGGIALGFALAVIASTSSLWLMVLMLLIPAPIGFAAIGVLTTGTLLSRWFYKRRGLALGLGAVATSGGGIFVLPVLTLLVESHGWRTALLIEAAVIVVIVLLLAVFVIRNSPSDMGLENHPENEGRPPADLAKAGDAAALQWRWHRILRDRTFWGVALALATISGTSQALITILVPHATQLGASALDAAKLISLFAAAAGLTKIVSGLLADYINRRLIIICAAAFMLSVSLILLTSTSYTSLLAATALAGIGLGCMLPAVSAIIAAAFGAPSFGRTMGLAYALLGLAVIILPPLTGAIYDRTQSYDGAFLLFAGLAVLAAASSLLIRRDAH